MSDTPRTDAAVYFTHGPNFKAVCPNFARELERENAALREQIDAAKKVGAVGTPSVPTFLDILKDIDGSRKLESENAKLRSNLMSAESEIILLREERDSLKNQLRTQTNNNNTTSHVLP